MPFTVVHVTHEAVEKIGGIGAVLEGLITSSVYQRHVRRTILVGPCQSHWASAAMSRSGRVLYHAAQGIDAADLGPKLRPIEWAFDTPIIYGARTFQVPGADHQGQAEVLLLDVMNIHRQRLAEFKHLLHEKLGIDSARYEHDWGFEEYVRLAAPAFYALSALLGDQDVPCILLAHEYMGLPTAFKAMVDGGGRFRTIFHAHECSTVRSIVEHHAGHDIAFYNAMAQAQKQGKFLEGIFGSQQHHARHALVSRAHRCDAVMSVGHYTARELHFLNPQFAAKPVDLVYNGIPVLEVAPDRKHRCRRMLMEYARALLGYAPDWLMSHVMRPVISKGVWRDLAVCHELEPHLAAEGKTAALFILTSGGGVRSVEDVHRMEGEYGWPRHHRRGYPDLIGPEVIYHDMIENFNAHHKQVQAVLVNQFGWAPALLGDRVPREMTIADFRIATDIEFGMATYEPFGISPLEPLCGGAICVYSSVCGCAGFVHEITGGQDLPNVLLADFTRLDGGGWDIPRLLAMGKPQRDTVEQRVAREVAQELLRDFPRTPKQREELLARGQRIASQMGWDPVFRDRILPVFQRVTTG